MAGVIGRKLCYGSNISFCSPQILCGIILKAGFKFGKAVEPPELVSVKGVVCNERKVTQPLEVKSIQIPKHVQKDQIRVRVSCCGLNVTDTLIIEGKYKVRPELPFTPGYEVAGKVEEVGSEAAENGFSVGDRVVLLNTLTLGGLAEECIANYADVWHIPSNLSFKKAAALVDDYGTALLALGRRAQLKANECVLITAAPGGLGLAAVDLAANVFKSKVIGFCETEEDAAVMREQGAWSIVTYFRKKGKNTPGDPENVEKILRAAGGKGVRVVYDALGHQYFNEISMQCVAHEGMLIVAGAAGYTAHCESFILPQSWALFGVSLQDYKLNNYPVYRQAVQDALDMCEQDLISPGISKEYGLMDVNAAFGDIIQQRGPIGKIIINFSTG